MGLAPRFCTPGIEGLCGAAGGAAVVGVDAFGEKDRWVRRSVTVFNQPGRERVSYRGCGEGGGGRLLSTAGYLPCCGRLFSVAALAKGSGEIGGELGDRSEGDDGSLDGMKWEVSRGVWGDGCSSWRADSCRLG